MMDARVNRRARLEPLDRATRTYTLRVRWGSASRGQIVTAEAVEFAAIDMFSYAFQFAMNRARLEHEKHARHPIV